MRHTIVLIAGIALLVLGVQGGIRLLVDHGNAGLLAWLPGGFVAQLICYLVVAVAGLFLADRGKRMSDRAGGID